MQTLYGIQLLVEIAAYDDEARVVLTLQLLNAREELGALQSAHRRWVFGVELVCMHVCRHYKLAAAASSRIRRTTVGRRKENPQEALVCGAFDARRRKRSKARGERCDRRADEQPTVH